MNVKAVPIANTQQVNPSGDTTKENDKRNGLSDRKRPKTKTSGTTPPIPQEETPNVNETEFASQILDSETTLDLLNSTPNFIGGKKLAVSRFVVGKNTKKRD